MSKEQRNQLKGNSTGQIEGNLGIKINNDSKELQSCWVKQETTFTTDIHKLKVYDKEWDISTVSKYFPTKY